MSFLGSGKVVDKVNRDDHSAKKSRLLTGNTNKWWWEELTLLLLKMILTMHSTLHKQVEMLINISAKYTMEQSATFYTNSKSERFYEISFDTDFTANILQRHQ